MNGVKTGPRGARFSLQLGKGTNACAHRAISSVRPGPTEHHRRVGGTLSSPPRPNQDSHAPSVLRPSDAALQLQGHLCLRATFATSARHGGLIRRAAGRGAERTAPSARHRRSQASGPRITLSHAPLLSVVIWRLRDIATVCGSSPILDSHGIPIAMQYLPRAPEGSGARVTALLSWFSPHEKPLRPWSPTSGSGIHAPDRRSAATCSGSASSWQLGTLIAISPWGRSPAMQRSSGRESQLPP